MPRIAGIDLPASKRIEIALTSIFGIGRNNVPLVLKRANVDPDKRAKNLNDDELARLQKAVDTLPTEGILKKQITENIKRLKQINTYRGDRHQQRLPVRGQRTRHNARTKRGKRMTVGALKKEESAKMDTSQKETKKETKKEK